MTSTRPTMALMEAETAEAKAMADTALAVARLEVKDAAEDGAGFRRSPKQPGWMPRMQPEDSRSSQDDG